MKLDAAWRARPRREKLLLGTAAVAVLLAVGDALVTAPLAKRLARTQAQNKTFVAQLAERGAKPAAAAKADGPAQETQLRERLEHLRVQAAAQRARLADTARLPETLRTITATVGSARLLELDLSGDAEGAPAGTATMAAAAAANSAAATAPAFTQASTRPRLHRLPITLKVAGTWAELHLLLGQVERHAQALQWTSLTLDNTEWPAIQLTLKAHVLATQPRWGAPS